MSQLRSDVNFVPTPIPNYPATVLPTPPEWTVDAACAGRSPEFDSTVHGEDTQSAKRRERLAQAARICHACPVLAACRAFADELPAHQRAGVWAGRVAVSAPGAKRGSSRTRPMQWREIAADGRIEDAK